MERGKRVVSLFESIKAKEVRFLCEWIVRFFVVSSFKKNMSRSPERNQNVEGGFRPVRNVGGGVPDLTLQAIMREMERLFDRKLEPIEDRLYRVERREQREMTPEDARQERERPIQDPYEASGQESDHSSAQSVRRRGRQRQ